MLSIRPAFPPLFVPVLKALQIHRSYVLFSYNPSLAVGHHFRCVLEILLRFDHGERVSESLILDDGSVVSHAGLC
jgi:hypothetical protein